MFFFSFCTSGSGNDVGLDTLKVAQASDYKLRRHEKQKMRDCARVDFKLNQGLSPLAQESRENRLVPAHTSVSLTGFAGRASLRKRTNTASYFKVREPPHKEEDGSFG